MDGKMKLKDLAEFAVSAIILAVVFWAVGLIAMRLAFIFNW
jgi:hypothetical protein